jgi:hypothetical protein
MQIDKTFVIFTCAPRIDVVGYRLPLPSRNPRESIAEEVTTRPGGLRRPFVESFNS